MSTRFGNAPWFAPQGFGDIPVGAVIAFAGPLATPIPSPPYAQSAPGASPPQPAWPVEAWGWTLCDGRALPKAGYGELWAMLGSLYGSNEDTFNLPNYGGYFLRGIDPTGKIDLDQASRTAAPGGSNVGVGSIQQSAFEAHDHQYVGAEPAGAAQPGEGSSITGSQTDYTTGGGAHPSTVKPSANETRPINIYVNFIIKFTAGLRPTAI
jgi:microcystin-dependent protein